MQQYRKYFISEQAIDSGSTQPNWGIDVLNVGHNIHPANALYPDKAHPHAYALDWEKGRVLNEYQLIYIASGSGIFEAEHIGTVSIKSGTVFLLFPGIWHRYKPLDKTGWEEYWIGFKGHYPEYLMNQDCFNANNPLINIGFNNEFLNVFNNLINALELEVSTVQQILACYTIQLLGIVYASALLKDKPQSRKEDIVNNMRYKIHENWATPLQMEELAKQYHVSYTWFRKSFKEITGVSPGQYHLSLKLEKARQMLADTSLSISEISYLTGFVTEFHFSKIFKKKMELSPSKYRQEFKK
jgi:AraC-like DNA-binding protein